MLPFLGIILWSYIYLYCNPLAGGYSCGGLNLCVQKQIKSYEAVHITAMTCGWNFWITFLHLRKESDRGWCMKQPKTSCFLYPVIWRNSHNVPIFMKNMFFCELFSPIWFCFGPCPIGLVYSSVHHFGNKKCSSDLQFYCIIRYKDERFLCLLASFVYLSILDKPKCLTACDLVGFMSKKEIRLVQMSVRRWRRRF